MKLAKTEAPSRLELEAMITSARGVRPSEPEGSVRAVKRFLYNWHNRDTDPVADDDFWHSVPNLPVELARDMGLPMPKLIGKASVVMLALGVISVLTSAVCVVTLCVLLAL